MPINKVITLDATGGVANHHIVRAIHLDLVTKTTIGTFQSYVSADTYATGKQPASFHLISASVDGLPADGQNPLDFIEAEVVKPALEQGASPSSFPNGRALFEGGVVNV
jgi:hypothetical protein